MIFIGGISQGQKEIAYAYPAVLCALCGRYGKYRVFMTYTYFSFFFVPIFKWNRRYYVQTSCCGSVYELDPRVGKALAEREDRQIRPEDLRLVSRGGGTSAGAAEEAGSDARDLKARYGENFRMRSCPACGYQFIDQEKEFVFCPKCGAPLDQKKQEE